MGKSGDAYLVAGSSPTGARPAPRSWASGPEKVAKEGETNPGLRAKASRDVVRSGIFAHTARRRVEVPQLQLASAFRRTARVGNI
jgi:hypothetical protein